MAGGTHTPARLVVSSGADSVGTYIILFSRRVSMCMYVVGEREERLCDTMRRVAFVVLFSTVFGPSSRVNSGTVFGRSTIHHAGT